MSDISEVFGSRAGVTLLPEGVHALTGEDRDVHYGVAGVGVDAVEESAFGSQFLIVPVEVAFVEDDCHRHFICLAGDQEAVDEGPLGLGTVKGDYQIGRIDVGGKDVALTGEVGGLADDVVLSRQHLGDGRLVRRSAVAAHRYGIFHAVAYGHGVGGRRAAQSQLSSYHCVEWLPQRQLRQQIVAARVLDHGGGPGMYFVLAHELCFVPRRYKIWRLCVSLPRNAMQSNIKMYTLAEIDKIVSNGICALDLKGEPEELYRPIEYTMSIGGKRIRPRLALLVCSLFSDEIDASQVYPALGLEIFHSFTLIHDDIMDRADLRRGQLTVYKKWNENIAILSGDVMSIQAYEYVSKAPSDKLRAVLEIFSDTARKVCEGQQYDMNYETMPVVTMDDYIMMIGLKTSALIAGAARMGAVLGGADAKSAEALYQYGYDLGLAFQITDDYLDTFGDPAVFGKNIGGDIMNNKKTWLYIEAARLAVGEQKARFEQIFRIAQKNPFQRHIPRHHSSNRIVAIIARHKQPKEISNKIKKQIRNND